MITLRQSGTPVSQQVNVRIVACARLHLGLISMHEGGPRKNGGVGFSIENPTAIVDVRSSGQLTIRDERPKPLGQVELNELIRDVEIVLTDNELDPAAITIAGPIQTHMGMGSGTAMRLAILEALFTLHGFSRSESELVEQSRRGGTSGVGVTSYFSGGMILDLGRASDGLVSTPSSQSNRRLVPAITLATLEMPNWPLCVCIPTNVRGKTQQEEIDFFDRVLPLSIESSYRSCYDAVFGIYASVKDRDYESFCRAVISMQTTAWKALEWNEYGDALQLLKRNLENFGVDCVGMSSLGPSLFCFASPKILNRLVEMQSSLNCEIIQTRPNNAGRVLLRSPS
jgi:beta-ribofuranosylaminobenzene 5'-phosphate synthase